jgi:hypothetical protein
MNPGADHIARERANGHAPLPRRLAAPEPPSVARLIEALAMLASGLAAVPRCRDMTEAASVSTSALIRAGEAYPDLLRRAEIRAALAIAAVVAEERAAPPARPQPAPPASTTTPSPSPPAEAAPSFSDADVEAFTQRLARQVAEQIKDAASTAAAPMSSAPSSLCDAAYFIQRIGELEQRRLTEKRRGEASRTTSTKLTFARKRLRYLLQNGGADDLAAEVRRQAERILGGAEQHAQIKGWT